MKALKRALKTLIITVLAYLIQACVMKYLPFRGVNGSVVFAAMAPARCAAIPAAQIIAPKPFSLAFSANRAAASGVRWADIICVSTGTPRSPSVSTAFETTGRSLSLPIITATFFILLSSGNAPAKAEMFH